MKGSEEQTTKSPKIAFLPTIEMRKRFNPAISSLAAVERLFVVGSEFCDRNDRL